MTQLTQPHICQYCGATTTQPDEQCWNNPKNHKFAEGEDDIASEFAPSPSELTPEDIAMIEREAKEYSFVFADEKTRPAVIETYIDTATTYLIASKEYLTQLKEERERVAKLREALEGVIRVADRKTAEFNKAKEALTY